jgi:hypothetical protein
MGTVSNADRVDGLHAVKYTLDRGRRNGRLIATNLDGYLPNNIIRKAPDADRLDGLDSSAFAKATDLPDLALETTTQASTANNTFFGVGRHTLTVSCPSGWVRTGGGYGSDDGLDTDDYTVTSTAPSGTNGWRATFQVTQSTYLRVVVLCSRITDA